MKNYYLSLMASALLVAFSACSKDDEKTEDPNVPVELTDVNLKGSITKNSKLLATVTYNLQGGLEIKNGASLTIPAGTVIIADDQKLTGQPGYIIVEQGGKIIAEGTKEKPIVFTAKIKEIGAWGGVHVCGKAPVNLAGGTGTSEIGDKTYGGTVADDNSGILKYVRVEYGGAQITTEKEHNGFTFYGVGRGTTLEYLQAYKCADDGFEWFGGNVNAKYLVSSESGDDLFDWTYGWSGKAQFLVGHFTKTSSDDPRGIEADGNDKNFDATPNSNPVIANVTVIGDKGTTDKSQQGIMLRRGTQGMLYNFIVKNFNKAGIEVRDDQSAAHVNAGKLSVQNLSVDNCSANAYIKEVKDANNNITKVALTISDDKKFENLPGFNNKATIALNGYVGSAAGGKDLSADAFFTKTDFIGGIKDDANDWTKGWTVK